MTIEWARSSHDSCIMYSIPKWRHQMETFSALLGLCGGNPPVIGWFPSQRPVTRNFYVFFDMCLTKRLDKQSRCRWYKRPLRSSWRHSNAVSICRLTNEKTLYYPGKYLSNGHLYIYYFPRGDAFFCVFPQLRANCSQIGFWRLLWDTNDE